MDYLLVTLFIVAMLILVTFAWAGILAAPWVPLRKKDIQRLLQAAKIRPGDKLYDLGCGDGRIVVASAKGYQANATGFELAILPYILCYVKIVLSRTRKISRVKYRNFYKEYLGNADIVVTFLTPWAMKKLSPKLLKELKPSARVVSYAFKVPNWKAHHVSKPKSDDIKIYTYKMSDQNI